MTIRHLYPAVEPSLNLDFANSKKLDSRITFTRGSTATYTDESGIIRTAAANEARFDHDTDGNSLGLLIEESRTNLFTHSQDFSTWIMNNQSVTANATTAPDSTITAYKLVESNASEFHRISISINPTGSHTMTVFAKAAERDILTLIPASTAGGAQPVYFDLTNGTISASLGSATSASIQALPNGWYRCSVTDSMSGFGFPFLGVAQTSGTQSYQGDGTSGIYIWGAQLEAGSFPTSYIPTSGSTVTRSADVASITGTNFSSWYNTAQSTWYAEVDQLYINSSGNQEGVSSIFADRYSNTGPQRWREYSWRGTQGSTTIIPAFNTPVTPEGSTAKVALAIDGVNAKMCVHGVLSSTGALGAYPGTAELRIGISPRLLDNWVGHISRLTYYPVRLPDATLQALTL